MLPTFTLFFFLPLFFPFFSFLFRFLHFSFPYFPYFPTFSYFRSISLSQALFLLFSCSLLFCFSLLLSASLPASDSPSSSPSFPPMLPSARQMLTFIGLGCCRCRQVRRISPSQQKAKGEPLRRDQDSKNPSAPPHRCPPRLYRIGHTHQPGDGILRTRRPLALHQETGQAAHQPCHARHG